MGLTPSSLPTSPAEGCVGQREFEERSIASGGSWSSLHTVSLASFHFDVLS